MEKIRCAWVDLQDELYVHYHDEEWGVPQYNDLSLFEHLMLEISQAGLSWLTILKRRDNYRKAFAGFNPKIVAAFGQKDLERLMQDAGIIRNRLKIIATINNAKKFLDIQKEFGSFSDYQWQFVGGKPLQPKRQTIKDIPALNEISQAFSKDLKKRGFTFVGPTNLYAHMQATGMVNDHTTDCFRYAAVKKLSS